MACLSRFHLFVAASALLVAGPLSSCGIEDVNEGTGSSYGTGAGGSGGVSVGGHGGTMAVSGGGGIGPVTIQCGEVVCSDQTCCLDPGSPGKCVDMPEACGFSNPLRCDDATDCPSPTICCAFDAQVACAEAPCPLHEVCIPGGTCSEGLTCAIDLAEPTGAKCVSSDVRIACGADTCAGPTPVCCWTDLDSSMCAPTASSCTSGRPFACASPADCGPGYFCCETSSDASCQGACKIGAFCATLVDCPLLGGTAAIACDPPPAGSAPPGVKMCVYP